MFRAEPWKYFEKYIKIIEKRIKQNRVITLWDNLIHSIHKLRNNDAFMDELTLLLVEHEKVTI